MASATAPAHRVGERVLQLVDAAGVPLADREVTVSQTRHAFGFGSTGFELIPHANGESDAGTLVDDWLGVFDTATLPFYRGDFEPQPGVTQTDRIRTAAQWFADRDVRLKGHPLVWHTVKAPWMDALPLDEVERVTLDRIRREVTDFRGLIGSWDVVNEAVIMPVFENEPDGVPNAVSRLARAKGRIPLVRAAFDEARAADPDAVLLINDFDLSSAYEILIEGLLEAGVRIDAIGLQTHMHQGYWGEETMLAMVDRFARYGLPLHLTENTLLSGELMPASIVDLNDYQPDVVAVDAGGRGAPGRRARAALPLARRASVGGLDHLLGHHRPRRLARGARRAAARPTARASPPTTRCGRWCAASGGCRRRGCARMPRGACA